MESTYSSCGIFMKFWKNCKKILKKFKRNWEENFKWFQENFGNIIGKNSNSKLMLLILWRNFKKLFWNNSSEIRENYKETLEKFWKHIGCISPKLKKNILMETLWNFRGNLRKNLRNIVGKLQIILEKNWKGTPKKFWKYFGR